MNGSDESNPFDGLGFDPGDDDRGAARRPAAPIAPDLGPELSRLPRAEDLGSLLEDLTRRYLEERARLARGIESAEAERKRLDSLLLDAVDGIVEAWELAQSAQNAGKTTPSGLQNIVLALLDRLSFTMESLDLRPVPVSPGDPIDPEVHQVQEAAESPGQKPGRVERVIRQGYTLQGRLIRRPLVVATR